MSIHIPQPLKTFLCTTGIILGMLVFSVWFMNTLFVGLAFFNDTPASDFLWPFVGVFFSMVIWLIARRLGLRFGRILKIAALPLGLFIAYFLL